VTVMDENSVTTSLVDTVTGNTAWLCEMSSAG
jgi:hypothetical protein